MDVGAHSVTSMVVERYLRVEKAKIKPKNNIKAKHTQKGQKSAKMPNQKPKFSRPNACKKAKFDLFGLTQGQMATLLG